MPESEAAQWRLQQCERHIVDCSSAIAAEGQHRLAIEVASTSRGIQLLTSQQLSCSATVSSGSAMGSMMQHVERELQYRCSSGSDSVMGNNTVSSSAVDVGQQGKNQNILRCCSIDDGNFK